MPWPVSRPMIGRCADRSLVAIQESLLGVAPVEPGPDGRCMYSLRRSSWLGGSWKAVGRNVHHPPIPRSQRPSVHRSHCCHARVHGRATPARRAPSASPHGASPAGTPVALAPGRSGGRGPGLLAPGSMVSQTTASGRMASVEAIARRRRDASVRRPPAIGARRPPPAPCPRWRSPGCWSWPVILPLSRTWRRTRVAPSPRPAAPRSPVPAAAAGPRPRKPLAPTPADMMPDETAQNVDNRHARPHRKGPCEFPTTRRDVMPNTSGQGRTPRKAAARPQARRHRPQKKAATTRFAERPRAQEGGGPPARQQRNKRYAFVTIGLVVSSSRRW